MGIEEQFENRNMLDIIRHNRKIEAVLNQASKDLAMKTAIFELKNPTKIAQGSFYKINKGLEKQVDVILNKLNKDIRTNIQDGVVSHWDMSNLKNNKLVGNWADGIKLSGSDIPTSFNQLNLGALDTFLTRTAAGMNLSERVWNLTNGAKDQLELYLSSGISTGRSAAEIAGDIKQYLNEPNRLFRRVRQEGKLVLSKAAKGYHPGAGIYRSSYRNALRLAKNEINMAYRMSDHLRRQQLPFVTGIEVHLSASHPRLDMCDDLAGKYPKGFIFMTWHVGCLCYTTSIMLNEKDSLKFMRTGEIPKSKYISGIPRRATNWIKLNAKTIAGYKNTPYFIRDNFTSNFQLKDNVTKVIMPGPEVIRPTDLGFVPAKTMKEAEIYGEGLIDPRGKMAGVNFGGISLDNANMINKRLTDLIKDYKVRPNFFGSSQAIRRALKRVYPYAKFGPIKSGTLAESWPLTGNESAISFNEKFFSKKGTALLEKSLEDCFATGFHKLKNIEHIVDHEYGHILDYAKKLSVKSEFVKEYTFLKDRSLVKTMISGYAEGDGLTESWAEIFALYRADKLPPLRKLLIEELLK